MPSAQLPPPPHPLQNWNLPTERIFWVVVVWVGAVQVEIVPEELIQGNLKDGNYVGEVGEGDGSCPGTQSRT